MKPHFTIQPDYSASADIKIHEPDIESVLREAAFVSSEGKAYRLFSENESPAFGNPFTLPESPFVKETAKSVQNGWQDAEQFESRSLSAKNLPWTAPSVEQNTNKQHEHLPLEETFKKMRAVEGICGHSQKSVSSLLFLSPQERNGQTMLLPKHFCERKPSAIPLTQIISEDAVFPSSANTDLPELTSEKPAVKPAPKQDDTSKTEETEIEETKITKESTVHLTVIKLPEALCRRNKNILFRKRKPAIEQTAFQEIAVQESAVQEDVLPAVHTVIESIEEHTVEEYTAAKIEVKVENVKHHLPAETENQLTAAFLAAGKEFRNDAAAVWSERVNSLEERALQQIKKLSVRLTELYNQGKRIISFNSFFSGEGCTTVAACVARELAARGYYVLLADTNENHPELTSQFSSLTDPDIYGIIPLEEKLHFLPFSDAMIESELDGEFITQRFTQLIAAMKNDYDFILLDNGGLSEHRLEERVKQWSEMNSDGVLLVLKQQNIQRINVNAVSGRLKEHNVELAGVAENYVPVSMSANPAEKDAA